MNQYSISLYQCEFRDNKLILVTNNLQADCTQFVMLRIIDVEYSQSEIVDMFTKTNLCHAVDTEAVVWSSSLWMAFGARCRAN